MQSPCIREASEACFHGCCPDLPEPHNATRPTPKPMSSATASRYDFVTATALTLHPNTEFTDHESLPSLEQSFSDLNIAYPQYSTSNQADHIRAQEYYHLSSLNHVCLDYIGNGLFSYSQQQNHCSTAPVASSSSAPPPPTPHSDASNAPFFNILYKSISLSSHIRHGGQESEFESTIRKRIMRFMNISEDDYSMVFTANLSSAFRTLADSYPFRSNRNLLSVYDYEDEAMEAMKDSSKKKDARVMSADFSWPNMRIHSRKLRKMVVQKKKKRKRGLFVFPLQSKVTGSRYSYLWMSLAQEHGWHVLLDASALGAKDMDTLGLSLFRPDFLICSFFKIFGANPSGFGCLFVKKSSASVLNSSNTRAGVVSLVPARPYEALELSGGTYLETKQLTLSSALKKDDKIVPSSSYSSTSAQQRNEEPFEVEEIQVRGKQKELSSSEIVELDKPLKFTQYANIEPTGGATSEIELRGLDHADSLGLILISSRVRYLVNWLVNALMSLQHPHSENGFPLVKIYGPKIKFDRGPAVAFNVFDWKGERIDPTLVQKLADRNNISLSYGILQHIWFSDMHYKGRERFLEIRATEQGVLVSKTREKFDSGISVITAAVGFLTSFEDVYRLWAFVSRFLDADFVEKERWRYMALNQRTVEV
ncbi:hypothetical protein RJ640_018805 [Escallonia rubra]|uniref:Molybdenum cofactor sulfurase n=1 Tax=Escallonia rubra TaxID=112253 RepID=A0AA88S2C5_9ASTE|nr:hypothetical protein RJ640_018805 [Escallonia rubra]